MNVIEKEVSRFGNSGHVCVEKESIGKCVRVVVGKFNIVQGRLCLDDWNTESFNVVVKRFGTSAHIIVPKKYIGKKIKLIINGRGK